jgi:hypothetical protein
MGYSAGFVPGAAAILCRYVRALVLRVYGGTDCAALTAGLQPWGTFFGCGMILLVFAVLLGGFVGGCKQEKLTFTKGDEWTASTSLIGSHVHVHVQVLCSSAAGYIQVGAVQVTWVLT